MVPGAKELRGSRPQQPAHRAVKQLSARVSRAPEMRGSTAGRLGHATFGGDGAIIAACREGREGSLAVPSRHAADRHKRQVSFPGN